MEVFGKVVALRRAGVKKGKFRWCLAAETVQSASLALQSIDNVHGSDGLSLGVLGVSNSISDHVLQKHLKNTTGLFVDETGDTLHTTTASQTTDGGLGDSLDVVTKDLPVPLGTSLAETFASFSTSRHAEIRRNHAKILFLKKR